MAEGQSVAYASEAGTPLIADPGYDLALAAREAGYEVTTAPGVSAVITALSLAGLPTDRFLFEGFLPNSASQRKTALREIAGVQATLVFYESPKRVAAMLRDAAEVLGPDREAALCRELTKKFEEFIRGDTEEILEILADKKFKGEFVVLIEGIDEKQLSDQTWTGEKLDTLLSKAMGNMNMSVKDAAAYAAKESGQPKRKLYARAVILSKNGLV